MVEEIVKETFSFGISGKKILPIGFNKSPKVFIKNYLSVSDENIISKLESDEFQEILPDIKKEIFFSINSAVEKTKKAFTLQQIIKPEDDILNPLSDTKSKTRKKNKLHKAFRSASFFLIIALIILITPLILMLTSLGSLYMSGKIITKNQNLGVYLINFSRTVSGLSTNMNFGISFYSDVGNLIYKSTSVAKQFTLLINSGKNLLTNVLGDKIYPFESYANDISANLDRIYTDISFIQSDIDEMQGILGKELRFNLDLHKISIIDIKQRIYNLKKFTSRLSEILGVNAPKKYLVLFQNNMELRPTGGFIGSFALITFDKGKMTEIVVNDVYSADGQLKGHVDPPEPIRKYLNEGGWYLRDANWDPDFITSAQKIEWFLDKEIDQRVDGVISVDLHFVKSLLDITGPINLSDFGKTITSENLYQITQSEVEDNFFPGSIKKQSFLTSLSRNLIDELKSLKGDKYPLLFKELYRNLEGRHIQVYLHDLNAQESVSEVGYSGDLKMNINCGLRCIHDQYQLVDANLGVNKSNFFVKRMQELILNVNKNSVSHELLVTYDNNAGPSIGPSGIYKNYARVVLPKEAKVSGVRLYKTNGTYQDMEYDLIDIDGRSELGFYFELMPASSVRVQVAWSINTSVLNQGGEYKLLVRKQSGTDNDAFSVKINSSDLSLTGKTLSVYNTNLAKDYKARFFFRPQ